MGDGALQIRSKDDENINQFCLAENKNVTFSCSEISALLTIPEIPMLPEFEPCELTTELLTTELIFTTEETGTVSVSSPQRTSTGASDLTVNALTTDSVSSEDKPPPSTTPVDGGSLTGTVTSSQQSTSNLDLLPSTTASRNDFIPTTPSYSQSGSMKGQSHSAPIQSLGSTTGKSGSTTGKNEVMITDRERSSSGTSPGLSGTGEGLNTSLDGPYTSPTEPVHLEFFTDVITEVETDLINLATTPLPLEMFSEQERGLSDGPFRETETPTMAGVTIEPTTHKIGNPNAALIIGFSLGGLFLIVVVAILFYKFYYKPKKSRSLTVNPTSGGRPEEVNQALRIHDPDKKFLELHPPNSLQAWDGSDLKIQRTSGEGSGHPLSPAVVQSVLAVPTSAQAVITSNQSNLKTSIFSVFAKTLNEKTETKESHIKAHDVDGKSSPSALPPVASTMQGGETDITKPKNKKTKKRKRKTPEANEELPNVESPVIGNGTGAPTEVIT